LVDRQGVCVGDTPLSVTNFTAQGVMRMGGSPLLGAQGVKQQIRNRNGAVCHDEVSHYAIAIGVRLNVKAGAWLSVQRECEEETNNSDAPKLISGYGLSRHSRCICADKQNANLARSGGDAYR
jgi:hypothetical protein